METQPPVIPAEPPVETGPANKILNTPGAVPFGPGFHIEGSKRQILGAIRARSVTDKRISNFWIILPLLIGLVGVTIGGLLVFLWVWDNYYDILNGTMSIDIYGGMMGGMIVILLTLIAVFAILAMLTYMLVERQNEHFKREAQLRMGIMSYLRASAGSPEKEASMAVEIATMNSLHVQAMQAERPHSAIGWALVTFIGTIFFPINVIFVLYLFYFLMENVSAHDSRWNMFLQQTGSAMAKLGHDIDPRAWYTITIPHRSFGFYLVLTLITLGLFSFYWGYSLIKDPNDHFQNQALSEDMLAGIVSR